MSMFDSSSASSKSTMRKRERSRANKGSKPCSVSFLNSAATSSVASLNATRVLIELKRVEAIVEEELRRFWVDFENVRRSWMVVVVSCVK